MSKRNMCAWTITFVTEHALPCGCVPASIKGQRHALFLSHNAGTVHVVIEGKALLNK